MKKVLLALIIIGVLGFLAYWGTEMYQFADGVKKDSLKGNLLKTDNFQNGDIIFQTSTSNQSKAIQLATKSKYSHMGIIYKIENTFFVYEAVQPVKLTRLSDWIQRGENGHYVVKRLENAEQILTPEALLKMQKVGEDFKGKPYDLFFEWSDDKIYCSELVWKIYNESLGIEIGNLERLSDFDLSHIAVQSKLEERYGTEIPMNEKVISPAAMFNYKNLVLVYKN